MRKPRRSRDNNGYYYPVDVDQLAADLVARDIDIAPTRQAWTAVARDIADGAGEAGRACGPTIADGIVSTALTAPSGWPTAPGS